MACRSIAISCSGYKNALAASEASAWRRLAEREGFEPPCRLPGKTLSRRPRYDHFGTSPLLALAASGRSLKLTPLRSPFAARSAPFAIGAVTGGRSLRLTSAALALRGSLRYLRS